MRLLSLFAVAMAGLIAVPALAQTPPPDGAPTRVRGTVEKLADHNLTVKSRDGQSLSITLAPDVDIITLVKKSLADIKPGDFVASTGVKDKDGKIHAIEARIFPKATPDGGRQFAWDLMPDSVMTNATVGTAPRPQGAVLHVTFTGGESEYSIGPDVPILANAPGDMSLLKPGAAVFVIALKKPDGTVTAARLYAEKTGSSRRCDASTPTCARPTTPPGLWLNFEDRPAQLGGFPRRGRSRRCEAQAELSRKVMAGEVISGR